MLSASAARKLRALELVLHRHRLRNQHLAGAQLSDPAEIVRWLGAVQSQDYAGAKWGIAQRGRGITERLVDEAFDAGRILRTHVMRPTWHFVSPDDIRWVLSLTAPRVHAANRSMYRQLDLDPKTLGKGRRTFERVLRSSEALTRSELQTALHRAGISATGPRLAYLVMDAELEQVICSGPRRGRQFTYALLDRRISQANHLARDEALVELTERYLNSHGPATVRDFSWWSGLTMKEAREGFEAARPSLMSETVMDRTYWFVPPATRPAARPSALYLLPNYDEALIAYKDRGSVVDRPAVLRPDSVFAHHVLVGDRVMGSWKPGGTTTAAIEIRLDRQLTDAEARALVAAGRAYGAFVERSVTISVVASATPSRAG